MTNVKIHTRRVDESHPGITLRLGRHVAHDPRSRDFPAETASRIRSVKHASTGLPLDQGQWGSCTGNALAGALDLAPDFKGNVLTEKDAFSLYQHETALEGYTTPPDDPGGTGLYVCRAAKAMGLVRRYRHAFSFDAALRAVVLRPAIFGVDWYEGMFSPDRFGQVRKSGQIAGGHEIVADEIDVARQIVGFWNSWGPSWGLGGRFYMSFSLLEELLAHEGDCTVPYV